MRVLRRDGLLKTMFLMMKLSSKTGARAQVKTGLATLAGQRFVTHRSFVLWQRHSARRSVL
jgi:hypothetical protein